MKYIFLAFLLGSLSAPALADLIQCDQNAADGMTYILASSSTSGRGIIISKNNAKGGTETIITTQATVTNARGTLAWSTPEGKVDWTLDKTKSECSVFAGMSYVFSLDNSTAALAEGKSVAGSLYNFPVMIKNPSTPTCQAMEAFPARPARLICHTL